MSHQFFRQAKPSFVLGYLVTQVFSRLYFVVTCHQMPVKFNPVAKFIPDHFSYTKLRHIWKKEKKMMWYTFSNKTQHTFISIHFSFQWRNKNKKLRKPTVSVCFVLIIINKHKKIPCLNIVDSKINYEKCSVCVIENFIRFYCYLSRAVITRQRFWLIDGDKLSSSILVSPKSYLGMKINGKYRIT